MADRQLVRTGAGMLLQIPPVKSHDDATVGFQIVVSKLNGGISLGDGTQSSQAGNLDAQVIEHTFALANTEEEIPWSKGRVAVGYIPIRKSAACDIYDSNSGKWSPTALFLQSSVAGVTVRLLVF